jgi:hypothetical protein
MNTSKVFYLSVLFLSAALPAFAGYVPGIRPYTSFNYGSYKPSESSEYYKLKKQPVEKKSSQVDPQVDQNEPEVPILVEVKNPTMVISLKAIKATPLKDRIESNDKYTSIMNEYNKAREIWLSDNSEMLSQGLLQDPGDATYYEKPLSELEQCQKDGEKNCDYKFKLVDGKHSQQELDDSRSSRKYLEEQNRKELLTSMFLVFSVSGLFGLAIALFTSKK